MNSVKELQHNLSQLIYSITDIKSLSEIKSAVDDLIKPIENSSVNNDLPWHNATLSMKKISSFEDVVKNQGSKKITFDELYPYIDDSENDYSVDDLLAALNQSYMNYLLDTNIIIVYSKNKDRAKRIEVDHKIFAKENNLAISIVSIAEINSIIQGANQSAKIQKEQNGISISTNKCSTNDWSKY